MQAVFRLIDDLTEQFFGLLLTSSMKSKRSTWKNNNTSSAKNINELNKKPLISACLEVPSTGPRVLDTSRRCSRRGDWSRDAGRTLSDCHNDSRCKTGCYEEWLHCGLCMAQYGNTPRQATQHMRHCNNDDQGPKNVHKSQTTQYNSLYMRVERLMQKLLLLQHPFNDLFSIQPG